MSSSLSRIFFCVFGSAFLNSSTILFTSSAEGFSSPALPLSALSGLFAFSGFCLLSPLGFAEVPPVLGSAFGFSPVFSCALSAFSVDCGGVVSFFSALGFVWPASGLVGSPLSPGFLLSLFAPRGVLSSGLPAFLSADPLWAAPSGLFGFSS